MIFIILSTKYQPDAPISVFSDRVGPFNNPHEFYKYFDLPFCQPTTKVGKFEGLGEAILGYELRKTNIAIQFGGFLSIIFWIFNDFRK